MSAVDSIALQFETKCAVFNFVLTRILNQIKRAKNIFGPRETFEFLHPYFVCYCFLHELSFCWNPVHIKLVFAVIH